MKRKRMSIKRKRKGNKSQFRGWMVRRTEERRRRNLSGRGKGMDMEREKQKRKEKGKEDKVVEKFRGRI